jgi:hypothetical protein
MSGDGCIRISRREFVGTLHPTGASFEIVPDCFATPGLDFNPGLGTLFPWLSNIATNFERFKFHRLGFELLPAAPTNTEGRVYAAVDYDMDDAVAGSKAIMLANRTTVEGAVWDRLTLQCDASKLHQDLPWKYVSITGRDSGVEPRTSYCGFLMVAYESSAYSYVKHDLYVTYDVELSVPQLEFATITDTLRPVTPGDSEDDAFPLDLTGGTATARWVTNSTVPDRDPIPYRLSSMGGCPPSLDPISGRVPPGAYDLRGVTRGNLTFSTLMKNPDNTTGKSPVDLLEGPCPVVDAGVYDSTGTLIGVVDYLGPTSPESAFAQWGAGPVTYSGTAISPSGNQGLYKAFVSFAIEQVRAYYPQAAWVVPYVVAGATDAIKLAITTGYQYYHSKRFLKTADHQPFGAGWNQLPVYVDRQGGHESGSTTNPEATHLTRDRDGDAIMRPPPSETRSMRASVPVSHGRP